MPGLVENAPPRSGGSHRTGATCTGNADHRIAGEPADPIARLTRPTPEDIRPSGRTVKGGTVPVEDLTMAYIKEGDEEVLKLFGL